MLKWTLSDETEALRLSFREWLKDNPPPSKAKNTSLEVFIERGRAWQKALAAGSWVGTHWPVEFGGRGLSLVEEAILQEEMVRAAAPQLLGLFGLTMVGPVLIQHGTESQKQQFLQKILSGEELWCQGFSEPGAGSDLAAIATRAESVDGGYRLTGQKVWTSFAHIADWCFVLARTSDEEKKHQGMTYFLVSMNAEGITTRPLRQISGDDEFNEVFFDGVFVPESSVVGGVGNGWQIAISTLMHERVVLTFARQLQSETALRRLLVREQQAATSKDPHHTGWSARQRADLADCVAEACAVRALAYSHLAAYAGGKEPGPEGSLDKLYWSESFQRISSLALSVNGRDAAGPERGVSASSDMHRYLYSRGRTIAAGTSEIQRSIISERVLGLPRGKR